MEEKDRYIKYLEDVIEEYRMQLTRHKLNVPRTHLYCESCFQSIKAEQPEKKWYERAINGLAYGTLIAVLSIIIILVIGYLNYNP